LEPAYDSPVPTVSLRRTTTMTSENQVTATFTHADGAIMAYDILGTQHLATNRIPIVLIGGMVCLKLDWEHVANGLSTIRPGKLPNLLSSSRLLANY
jgi:hypothetical protein